MNPSNRTLFQCRVVEEEIDLTLGELCQACNAHQEQVTLWVMEGILEPIGKQPQDWTFTGPSLRRARLARRLSYDLEINSAGVALALDLLDEIDNLKAKLRRTALN